MHLKLYNPRAAVEAAADDAHEAPAWRVQNISATANCTRSPLMAKGEIGEAACADIFRTPR
jgi:hypothetical protein